jgi:hypothetical protein
MSKIAPWQLDVALKSIVAALARFMGMVVLAGIDTGRSPEGTFKVTAGLPSVVVQSEWLASGVIALPVSSAAPTSETGKLFGFVILKTTSPVLPGSSGVDGVPAVAMVTVCIVPTLTEAVPEP